MHNSGVFVFVVAVIVSRAKHVYFNTVTTQFITFVERYLPRCWFEEDKQTTAEKKRHTGLFDLPLCNLEIQ